MNVPLPADCEGPRHNCKNRPPRDPQRRNAASGMTNRATGDRREARMLGSPASDRRAGAANGLKDFLLLEFHSDIR